MTPEISCRLPNLKTIIGCGALVIAMQFSFCLSFAVPVVAQQSEAPLAWILFVTGEVLIKRYPNEEWRRAQKNDPLYHGDVIDVVSGKARISYPDGSLSALEERTVARYLTERTRTPVVGRGPLKSGAPIPLRIRLFRGVMYFFSPQPTSFLVDTPFITASVTGTEFQVTATPNESLVQVFDGSVRVKNVQDKDTNDERLIDAGKEVLARQGKRLEVRTIVRPRDAVQWALYYPPLVDYHVDRTTDLTSPALQLYRKGDVIGALEQLERTLSETHDVEILNLRAGLSLSVGRVAQARADIEQALRVDPDNGIALALQSVMAMVQNERERALQLAREATLKAPESAIPQIALSYAHQAAFDIDHALAATQRAVALAPQNPLARARLAELWLSTGDVSRAQAEARKAMQLNPILARTQTVLGFAYLARIQLSAATEAFEKAIQFDQASPLPRLGLGLAKIRDGHLAEGRQEIAIAAILDPNNALIRSYLGKAYFEEHKDKLDAKQLARAKQLDPNDPTPWFYDAIRKQTLNRPAEALKDLQNANQRNKNRAVYRSKLHLDSDDAARGASLGRIYQDLGFKELALLQGWKSLGSDPSEHSAHRLLADAYATRPRHDIARVSELLQSQLLQPLNMNNLQPQLAEANLQILEGSGPSARSFNEFNPLFRRDGVSMQADGLVGNNGTISDDVVLSGIKGPVSWSVGQFHYESNGFRPNNDLNHDIYNVFVQGEVTPDINLQAEYRRRETTHGDLALNVNPDDLVPLKGKNLEQDTLRVGGRYSPAPHSDVIVSLFYNHRREETDDAVLFRGANAATPFDTFIASRDEVDDSGIQGEAQYLFRHGVLNGIVGGGFYDIDVDTFRIPRIEVDNIETGADCSLDQVCNLSQLEIGASTRQQENAYLYTNLTLYPNLVGTIGLSYDSFRQGAIDVNTFNPKVGLRWGITDDVQLRAAYFQTVKRALVVDATIEPTHVSGFNQFFDDLNGTKSERVGVGLDARISDGIYGGLEVSVRDLRRPIDNAFHDEWENLYRAYAYWTPHDHWAISVQAEFEHIKRPSTDPTVNVEPGDFVIGRGSVPSDLQTFTLPLSTRYFNPNGVFAQLGGTFVLQTVGRDPDAMLESGHENFFLLDAVVGYRIPKRLGIISLEVRNVLDKRFRYQDQNFREPATGVTPRFIPDRLVLGRVTVNF